MGKTSFESAISAMSGETKQSSTMIERILEDVLKNDIRVNIQFTERYTEVVNYIKGLGWTPNCLKWNYEFNNNVKLQVLSTSSGYTLTVGMHKEPVIKYPERTFISAGVLISDAIDSMAPTPNKETLLLMYKDTVICEYNKGLVKIKDKLPYGLYLVEDDDLDARINNVSNFRSWCSRRMLSLDREHAKVILNSVGLRQAVTDADRMQVALQYKCLSLIDCYWVKSISDKSLWKDVNLYQHSLNEAVPISLCGKSVTLQNIDCISQDISTNGVAPKAWVRTDKGIYLYKGDVGNNSVGREVAASNIIRSLALVNTINYSISKYDDKVVSSCKLYTEENISIVSLEDFITTHNITGSLLGGLKYIILAAYLIGDSDRHCGNVFIEYCRENNSLRVGPMIDFNHAFECEDCLSSISLLVWNVNETLREAVKRLFRIEKLKDILHVAEMYATTEPDNKYWQYVIRQLKSVID